MKNMNYNKSKVNNIQKHSSSKAHKRANSITIEFVNLLYNNI
jgi:hypothetical protein